MTNEELIKRLEDELEKRKEMFDYYHDYEPIDDFGYGVLMEVGTAKRTLEWVIKLAKGEDPGKLVTFDWV